MRRLFAIIWLTWKAAFRYRLFWALAALLVLAVVALPILIKDDGTARGFTQILLTYTLGITTGLLGFATLWLACGTLARDVEEAQIQLVVDKPIARWQVWLGKWLGIVSLNALLLAIAGGSVFSLLLWRAEQLPEAEQNILRKEILVARGSLKEPVPDLRADVEHILRERLAENPMSQLDRQLMRKQIEEQLKAAQQVVPSGYARRWEIDLGLAKHRLRDQPLFLRVKFHSPESRPLGDPPTYQALFLVGPPESSRLVPLEYPSLAAETFHEIEIPKNVFDENGVLTIEFRNYNQTSLLFPVEEGLEVLYREGGFALNFARGLGVILSWLALLAALGLAAASFLSFPVAAFVSLAVLLMGLSSGTLRTVVEEGAVFGRNHETGAGGGTLIDHALVPVFKGALQVINLVQGFSPIDSLSSGRSITWGELALAWTQIVLLLGGLLALFGIYVFNRRELATAQGSST